MFAINNFTCACSIQFKYYFLLENEDLVLKSSFYSYFFKIYEQNIDKTLEKFCIKGLRLDTRFVMITMLVEYL